VCSYGVFGANLFEFFAMAWHTKKVVLEDFLESDSDREFLFGQKKEKKTERPTEKGNKTRRTMYVASVCEQDARKTCGNESTIYYECGFKAILKRAFKQ